MTERPLLSETYGQMLREQLPNLFRLYLNPYVAQTCFCLERYVKSTWTGRADEFQSFLANGFDEALSGAIKLARYCGTAARRPTTGLVIDSAGRLGPFAETSVNGSGRIEFLPGLVVVSRPDELHAILPGNQRFGFVVLVSSGGLLSEEFAPEIRALVRRDAPVVITCVERGSLAAIRQATAGIVREVVPDIVVFDESFANRAVPFGAFTARRALYDHWNRPGKTTFHSTTYQPNTISSLHFLRCLENADPEFYGAAAYDLERIQNDLRVRGSAFKRLYSPSLYKAIRTTGFRDGECPRRRALRTCRRTESARLRRRGGVQHPRPQSRRLRRGDR